MNILHFSESTFCSPQARYSQEWDEGVLCEVQWSNLCETGETRHHDQAGKSTEHCSSSGRVKRVGSFHYIQQKCSSCSPPV